MSPDSILSLHELCGLRQPCFLMHLTSRHLGKAESGRKPDSRGGCLTPFHDPEGKEQWACGGHLSPWSLLYSTEPS